MDTKRLAARPGVGCLRPVLAARSASATALARAREPNVTSVVPSVADVKSKFSDEDDMLLGNDTRVAEACLLAGVVCFLRLDVSLGSRLLF